MKYSTLCMGLAFFLCAVCLHAEDVAPEQSTQTASQALPLQPTVDLSEAPEVYRELHKLCAELLPAEGQEVAFNKEKRSLTISINMRTFLVYDCNMKGEYSKEPVSRIAPSADGIRVFFGWKMAHTTSRQTYRKRSADLIGQYSPISSNRRTRSNILCFLLIMVPEAKS